MRNCGKHKDWYLATDEIYMPFIPGDKKIWSNKFIHLDFFIAFQASSVFIITFIIKYSFFHFLTSCQPLIFASILVSKLRSQLQSRYQWFILCSIPWPCWSHFQLFSKDHFQFTVFLNGYIISYLPFVCCYSLVRHSLILYHCLTCC